MPERIFFWSAVLFCASFYFSLTIEGLALAGQYDAALANLSVGMAIACPSFVMLVRDVWGMFRRRD